MRTIYIIVPLKHLYAIMKYSILCRFRYEYRNVYSHINFVMQTLLIKIQK